MSKYNHQEESEKYSVWGGDSLFRSLSHVNLIIPVVLIFCLYASVAIYLFQSDLVDTSHLEGRVQLQGVVTLEATKKLKVTEVLVKANQYVSEGDVVARFEDGSVFRSIKSGSLMRLYFDTGTMVTPGEPMALLSSMDAEWAIRLPVTEMDALKFKPGQKALISFENLPDMKGIKGVLQDFTGHFPSQGHDVDIVGSYKIAIDLEQDVEKWFKENQDKIHGMKVRVVVITGKQQAIARLRKYLFGT